MFKVLTMSNTVVKEELTFTFDVREDEKKTDPRSRNYQQLIFSRDLNKLMEVYSDSRCSIYTKKKNHQNKLRVEWQLTY